MGNHWLAAGASLAAKGKQQSVQFSVGELAEALAKLVVELDELDHDAARGELGWGCYRRPHEDRHRRRRGG